MCTHRLSLQMLSLLIANRIALKVVQTALEHKYKPIAVCIVDANANIITSMRMDSCSALTFPQFAYAKAHTCVAMNVTSSRAFRDKYTASKDPSAYCQMLSMVNITQGKMAPFPGGILLQKKSGEIIGAVGVSGAAGDEDELCALTAKEIYKDETGEDLV